MAKKNNIPSRYLFVGGTILFSLAWLMPSFPLLAFIGFAPFVAIAGKSRKDNSLWNFLELVMLGLFIGFFSSTLFNPSQIVICILQAILFTLPFLGYAFARSSLGEGVSIITLVLFWLAMEYLLLKWIPLPPIFLADIFKIKLEWVQWNSYTGYLGASLWILTSNIIISKALLTDQKVNWPFLMIFLVVTAGAIIYSYFIDMEPITRQDMLSLYMTTTENINTPYSLKGEFIPRTAAWISVLILLFTFVKSKTGCK